MRTQFLITAKINLWLLLIAIGFNHQLFAQAENNHPKRELRGVWIATVANIDWPVSPYNSVATQKKKLLSILDAHKKTGINSIYLQVRPSADAFYGRGRELWSRYLTAKQGKAPNPYWDPLDFAIKEAHKRSMELHAWINPYRASNSLDYSKISGKHIMHIHPKWFFKYGGKIYFNPGLPEVRDYIVQVVLDVVRNYDVDGIHMDDYFYPYPEKYPLPDVSTFAEYGKGFSNIEDWRRNNVDLLVKTLYDSIHAVKNYVKFGISPYGIWRNKADVPEGSETSGRITLYHSLYANARKWVREGWVDYINPQIYFPFYYKVAPFEKMMDWWAANNFGRNVYIGMAAFLAERKTTGWKDKSQLPNQMRYLRQNPHVQGSVFFSSKSLTNNVGGFRDSLRNHFYIYPALVPAMPWIDSVPPLPPKNLKATASNGTVTLSWVAPANAFDGDNAYGYVIYRFRKDDEIDIAQPKNILKINFNATTSFIDTNAKNNTSYIYVVTTIDRLKNESTSSNSIQVQVP